MHYRAHTSGNELITVGSLASGASVRPAQWPADAAGAAEGGPYSSSPSACVIDIQSVKTSTSVPARSQGNDANETIVGPSSARPALPPEMIGELDLRAPSTTSFVNCASRPPSPVVRIPSAFA